MVTEYRLVNDLTNGRAVLRLLALLGLCTVSSSERHLHCQHSTGVSVNLEIRYEAPLA